MPISLLLQPANQLQNCKI